MQRRRDETLRQLGGLPVVRPAGGWSLLLDVAGLGLDCVEVSDRLLEQKVAATPMRGWGGEIADRHVRFVFSNEPVDRLTPSARGCAQPWRPPATEPDHGLARTNTRGRARGATLHLAASASDTAV